MKIAFWGPEYGKGMVTTNMACVSAMFTLKKYGNVTLLENCISANTLGSMILPGYRYGKLKESAGYMHRYGVEHIIKQLFLGYSGEEAVKEVIEGLPLEGLSYIPQSYIPNTSVYDYNLSLVGERLFDAIEQYSDYMFADSKSGENVGSGMLLSSADIIVVNLPADIEKADFFFRDKNYESIRDKAFYIFNSKGEKMDWMLMSLSYDYSIKKTRMGIIPYNAGLEDAIRAGHLLNFVNNNFAIKSNSRDSNFDFINRLKTTTQNLKKYIDIKKKHDESYTEKVLKNLLFP